MNRIILHIDMDAFFAEIEERENPHFCGKSIVVGADPKEGKGRGVVSACNYQARKYGIHSAMPISIAWGLCPQAIFLPVNMPLYLKTSERIMKILEKYSPAVEQVSLDEAYLDVYTFDTIARKVHTSNRWEEAEKTAKKLKNEILEKEKLPSTVGIGPNKLIAKMATNQGKPDGLLIITPKRVQNFLDPLDIEEIPGIGPKTAEILKGFKANKVKDLRKLSKPKLKELFGKVGESIYEKARGIDEDPIVSEGTVKSISKERTFEKDIRDSEIIFETFDKIIEGVYREILKEKISFKTIVVICRFSGFETHTKSKTLKELTQDFEILDSESKKLLLRSIIENPKPIRLIGLRVSNLL